MMSFRENIADYSENHASMKQVSGREIIFLKVLIALLATCFMLVSCVAFSQTRSSEKSIVFQRFARVISHKTEHFMSLDPK
jgi:hypothetical protein